MPVWIPRDYQRALQVLALECPRSNWWAGPGTGKTSTAIDTFDYLRMLGEAERVLVLSTKNICTLTWPAEVQKWENFKHLSIAVAVGSASERVAALRKRADITTANYDVLPWLVETLGDAWPFDMVIADESSKLKGLRVDIRKHHVSGKEFQRKGGGSTRAAALSGVAHKRVRRWLNLTGSPAANSLVDLWGQMWFIDAGQRLGRSFTSFRDRWFNAIRGSDGYEIVYVPSPFAKSQIEDAIKDVTLSISARDYMDLPQTLTNVIKVKLPDAAYKLYREMEREMFVQIESHEIEAFNAGSKSMKCRQLASGAAYVKADDGNDTAEWVTVHDAKLDALEDLAADLNGAPLLVAYQFRSDLARLLKRFPKGRHFDGKRQTLDLFRAGRIPMLFTHPASAGHGIDGMQDACQDIAFFSMTWNLEEYEQIIERIGAVRQVSAGFFRDVRVHILAADRTVELEMIERTQTKASVQDSLKAAMSRRG